jgi:hypothetical protein
MLNFTIRVDEGVTTLHLSSETQREPLASRFGLLLILSPQRTVHETFTCYGPDRLHFKLD